MTIRKKHEYILLIERNYEMKNKIFRLSIALMLVISLTLSLSSCAFDFNITFGEGGFEWNEDGYDSYLPDDGNQNVEGGSDTTIESDNFGEFYPGIGQGEVDKVDPLTKTLLSTVDIIAGTGLTASAGSGVIYKIDKEKGDAYIITNMHVVYLNGGAAKTISVYLYGMENSAYAIPATFVGGSVTYDIAVLKISGSEVLKNSYATAITVTSSDNVRVFDRVFAVGNAEGAGLSATEGIISVENENIDITAADNALTSLRVMRVDAPVNHGNSGGGLYDEVGRFIGIVSAKEVSEDVDNMGYAIPSDLVIKLADNILRNCNGTTSTQVVKPLMGITITAVVTGVEIDEGGTLCKVQMVEVTEVSAGSLATGKVLTGDIINSITVDGATTKVYKVYHVTDAMLDANEGSTVSLNITRGEETVNVTFTIAKSNLTLVK